MSFLEDLADPATLRRAWEAVAAKRGVPGIDRVTVDDFAAALDAGLARLSDEIAAGRYRPLPVLRIRPRFLGASDRALVVPAVRDRVVQRTIADLLSPKIEPLLSPACRAFRKGAGAQAAADDVGRWVADGSPWVLRADVKSFFDSIQPQVLLEKLEPFTDPDGLRFLGRLLRQKVFDRDQVAEPLVGIPQGSPLSPLLANLYLNDLDHALAADDPRYLRYCDDLIVLAADEPAVRTAQGRIEDQLLPLGLQLNEAKSRICRAEDGFTFLGYQFGPAGRGPSTKAVAALHARLAELDGADPLDPAEVDALHRGWTAYFGHHPECWTGSPAGLLALLRGAGEERLAELLPRLLEARSRLPTPACPDLSIELARAWIAAGRPELAWAEMAEARVAGRGGAGAAERWAEVLEARAEEMEALTSRLAGDADHRRESLADALAELGRFDIASRLAAVPFPGAHAETGAPRPPAPEAPPALEPHQLALLSDWFEGRDGVHAVESIDRGGRRSFVPVHRPIAEEDWRRHLRGEATLALPLIRAGDVASVAVLDVDLERKLLSESPGRTNGLLGRALGAALRLRHELARRGCASLLELSGAKGYHLWLRFDEPVPCFRLRRWLLGLVTTAGALPEGVRVEIFPKRDRLRPEEVGPVVKLPLGVHGKTGTRCALLDERGQPVADPFEVLRTTPSIPRRIVMEAEEEAAEEGTKRPRAGDAAAAAIGPRAQQLLDGCGVLGYLAKKARDTAYLDHTERSTLLCTLGHLGEEGRTALHTIIGHTYNYSPEVTERHVGRLPEFPMSCPKVRERHPEGAAVAPCTCRFQLRGRGYPTPVLYVLKPSEVPAFRKKAVAPVGEPAPTSRSRRAQGGPAASAVQREAEALLQKLSELKRHRRGIDRSIARVEDQLAALLDEAGQTELQTRLGLLRRLPAGASGDSDGGETPSRARFVIEV